MTSAPVAPITTRSFAHIHNPRLLRVSKILWLIFAVVTVVTWVGTRPIFAEMTRTVCTANNCHLFTQLTANEVEILKDFGISVATYATYIDLTNAFIMLIFT